MKHLDVTVPLSALCLVLVIMTFKHFVADFVLQTNWIARGKERVQGWATPLAAHVAIHGVMTLMIALAFMPALWWLALVDMAVHAVIDRGKSVAGQIGKWPLTDARFWWLIGFDQFLHQLTNIALAAVLVAAA